jgi:hypothetical protein
MNPLSPTGRLPDVLLAYLDASVPHWPGGDGLTLEDALASYTAAAGAGLVPDPVQLRQRHPDLAGEVDEFFSHNNAQFA